MTNKNDLQFFLKFCNWSFEKRGKTTFLKIEFIRNVTALYDFSLKHIFTKSFFLFYL